MKRKTILSADEIKELQQHFANYEGQVSYERISFIFSTAKKFFVLHHEI